MSLGDIHFMLSGFGPTTITYVWLFKLCLFIAKIINLIMGGSSYDADGTSYYH